MKKFLQANPLLAAGVILPVALVALLWLAQWLPQLGVADPQYRLVVQGTEYTKRKPGAISYTVNVKDDQVSLWVWPRWTKQGHTVNEQAQVLFVLEPDGSSSEEVDLTEPLRAVPQKFFSCLAPELEAPPGSTDTARQWLEAKEKCDRPYELRDAYSNEYLEIPITSLAGKKFYPGAKAPDGYTVLGPGTGNTGVLGDLFYRDNDYGTINIGKDGRTIRLDYRGKMNNRLDIYQTRPLGWLAKE